MQIYVCYHFQNKPKELITNLIFYFVNKKFYAEIAEILNILKR